MATPQPSTGRPRLSAAMIVRDAADRLPASLHSVAHLADEIVVLDTGSADSTMDVARAQGAVVERATWQDSFSVARNECLRHVTGDWVLWLDAGETIDATAARQLQNFLRDSADPTKAYLLFIERPAAHAADCRERIGQLRLLPNRPDLKFAGRLRERILPAIQAAGLEVDALDCAIHRGEDEHDPGRRDARAQRNLRLVDLALAEEGDQPSLLAARAEALSNLGRTIEATQLYRRVVDIAERGSTEMLEGYYGLLASMDDQACHEDDQVAICLEALDIYPLDAQLLCGMGSYLLRQQRLDLAERSYELAVRHGQLDPATWHLSDLADVAAACLSLVLRLQGDAIKAEQVLVDALAARPDSLRLRRQFLDLLIKSGRVKEALTECGRLPIHLPHRDQLSDAVRGAALAATGQPAEAVGPLTAAYDAGCRDAICLRWLAAAHLALGHRDQVESLLAEWERLEPANLEIQAIRQSAAACDPGESAERVPLGVSQSGVSRPMGRRRGADEPLHDTISVYSPD